MFNIDFTFLWTAVDLLLIYLIVNHFLFKRLGAHMDKRAAAIAADIEHGEDLKAEGEAFRQQQEIMLTEAAAQRDEMLADARTAAEKEYARILSEANRDAALVKKEARGDIDREREQMKRDLSGELVSLTIAAASQVVQANMDSERNRELAERFLSKGDTEGAA